MYGLVYISVELPQNYIWIINKIILYIRRLKSYLKENDYPESLQNDFADTMNGKINRKCSFLDYDIIWIYILTADWRGSRWFL